MRSGAMLLVTVVAASGCATNPPLAEVCLRQGADRCFGPSVDTLTESQLRRFINSFTLSCDGIDKITDEYRKSCVAQLRQAHSALSEKWSRAIAFSPMLESDIQPSYPCVDIADRKSGQLTGGWCWEQLQVTVAYSWTPATPNKSLERTRGR